MVQPQLVQTPVAVPVEEVNSGGAGTGHLGTPAIHERTKIIDQDGCATGIHVMMMPGTVV
ncbi:hypothetical protein [Micromonospora sp. WMMD987]|nr:hypothetical protein [Micromonospora sp. WMMD987]WFE98396.1 hypothetical protein O7612_07145 [Micromonospora sp. WMMD987]